MYEPFETKHDDFFPVGYGESNFHFLSYMYKSSKQMETWKQEGFQITVLDESPFLWTVGHINRYPSLVSQQFVVKI